MRTTLAFFALLAVAVPGCGGDNLCKGVTGACTQIPAGASESTIQSAFVRATAGATLAFGAGVFKLTNGIDLATANVTVKGQGIDVTVLDFAGQTAGSEALYVMRGGFTLSDLTVRDSKGDAVKIEGADGVTLRRVKVMWSKTDLVHGPYGLYPVQCSHVLIEDCEVQGAADAGIYVGQSDQIVVRRNNAHDNVAGIEIENSHHADVSDNTSQDNTAGLLVFALPDLQVVNTGQVRVFHNTVLHNNTANFADPGGVVSHVPAGTGLIVMAADQVEVFNNTVSDNGSIGLTALSYYVTQLQFDPMKFYPFPTRVYLHDNTLSGNGAKPDTTNPIGIALKATPFPGGVVSAIVYDGIIDPTRTGGRDGDPMDLCINNNGSATFANAHADQMDSGSAAFSHLSTDPAPYTCTLDALPAVTLP